MRVVSMVPSWTETLIAAGVKVVGRTRFCLHPDESVKDIPIIGGTKDWDLEKVLELKPDLILLDQEENPKFMAEQDQLPFHWTHIQDIQDLPSALLKLGEVFSNEKFGELAQRWEQVLAITPQKKREGFSNFPGVMEVGRLPQGEIKNVLYMIWNKPWMCVGRDTFIGSVLSHIGIELNQFETKYPEVSLEDYNSEETLLLFSSEPYPFLKKKKELTKLPFPFLIVDGESYSWFGIRSLEFLEKL